jgi:hypothetical protein
MIPAAAANQMAIESQRSVGASHLLFGATTVIIGKYEP